MAFDMAVLNDMDRLHLVAAVVDRLPQLGSRAAYRKYMFELLVPATPDRLHQVGGDRKRFDQERRPALASRSRFGTGTTCL
jgi:phosphoketolase